MRQAPIIRALPLALALALAGCGGGGGGDGPGGPTSGPSSTPSPPSSGAITAFGSVFVNGHEFDTSSAQAVDDDTGDTSGRVSALEVGQVVDVDPARSSTSAAPVAQWLHVHPLARGYVDAVDASAGTLTVMGQGVSLDSGTLFSDHRACVDAATNACTAIADATGLAASAGGTGGSYVTVDGYLFSTAPGSAQIVATLVSVRDVPTAGTPVAFKAEGVVSVTMATASTAGITIGGLDVDLDHTTCRVNGHATPCAGAFAAGDVVSVFSATAPALPAASFAATVAMARKHLPVQTAGASVEFDGRVSASIPASGSTAATFVVRGVTVDTSGLPAGTSLPAVGDMVRVAGTVSSDGLSVTASAIRITHAARSVSYGVVGDVTAVAAGAASGTFDVTVLGQTIVVSGQTRLSDRQSHHWFDNDPQTNPFNIATFQAYLAASASQHVAIKAARDSSGTLQALSLTIRPASTSSELAGPVDATPAPVAASASAAATFSIDGVPVSAAAGAIHFVHHAGPAIAAGDEVAASGSFAAGTLGVLATPGFSNFVIDFGAPRPDDDDVPLY